MFNKLVSAAVVAILFTAPAVSAEMKIVVLDPVRAILESGKVLAEAAIKNAAEQEELRAAAEEMQALQAKLQKTVK